MFSYFTSKWNEFSMAGPQQEEKNESNRNHSTGWVTIISKEEAHPICVPTESDGSLLLTNVTAGFPNTCGLKYLHTETRTWRSIRVDREKMLAPEEGWDPYIFYCIKNEIEKEDPNPSKLIVLGLAFATKEEAIRQYFEQYGELKMLDLKKLNNGKSRGFAFIEFAKKEVEMKVVMENQHTIDGRRCQVKYPYEKKA